MQLTEIYSHPLKSGRGNALNAAEIGPMGLAFDRHWMLVDGMGKFITGRAFPRMVLIETQPDAASACFSAPGCEPLQVNVVDFTERLATNVWNYQFDAWAGSDEADFWFSDFLGIQCRLVYIGAQSERKLRIQPDIPMSFADGYPLLLIGEASLADLNGRLAQPVTMRHFRPNLVISTDVPFIEDQWQRLRIGQVEFELVKPCTRCIFTTVDPASGVAALDEQPLRTLNDYRLLSMGTCFGMNMLARTQGIVRLGDSVTLLA
ncbi:MOSC domain-containing protein [Parachitinimonas caeni]|uniref:MOSC domain-containing protein n=1 Tax=Parachitinimonas caeni TaxID=3031301 RepID=A0ABT7DV57_9NEIS|nr:MOSC domain-containing protein [Parachitinimonas caeni]MDK2123928.1 MOSC domain-containing protein [Parachitinimonas caeni]